MGDATHKSAISSLQEVRDLIKELPEPDLESAKKAASHDAQLTKPDRKSTRLNSSHSQQSRMPSSA